LGEIIAQNENDVRLFCRERAKAQGGKKKSSKVGFHGANYVVVAGKLSK
jgi:hypothetical protein